MTQHQVSRRRFLRITAALPLAGLSPRAMAAQPVSHWQGRALGAEARIILSGLDQGAASPFFAQVRDEIARLEGVFSLYQPQSDICRLNDAKLLLAPAPEMLEVLSLSRAVWNASQGAFDPTVQPLWLARARGGPAPMKWDDFGDVDFSTEAVRLKAGAALTLNGIAQGYITDRIAEMLRAAGLTDLVVDAGEQRALGNRPQGGGWQVGVADPMGSILTRLSLSERALATSSPQGTLLAEKQGHIIDGRTGDLAAGCNTVSISHARAAVADALSTAACCLTVPEMDAMLMGFEDAKVVCRV
ncbi:MAG: FAD:protein FMN transferase [Pseudomonadota bacterium]